MSNDNAEVPETESDKQKDDDDKKNKSRREEEFEKYFSSYLPNDVLVDTYSCALQKKKKGVIVQGRLFVSDKHICFHSLISKKKAIPFQDIKSIDKKTTARVFANAIQIVTKEGARFIFTSFIKRDNALQTMNKVWCEITGKSLTELKEQDNEQDTTTGDFVNDVEDGMLGDTESSINADESEDEDEKAATDDKLKTQLDDDKFKTNMRRVRTAPGTQRKTKRDKKEKGPASSIVTRKSDQEVLSSPDIATHPRRHIKRQHSRDERHHSDVTIELIDLGEKSKPKVETTLPPISDSYQNWNETVKRQLLGEREVQGSIPKFWQYILEEKKIFQAWGSKLEFTEINVGDWADDANPPNCLIRTVSWVAPLKLGFGPKTASVTQTQRVKLKNINHLEFDRSTVTHGVPLADYFTLEERWNVKTVSEDSIKIVVEGGVNWLSSTPWASAAVKGIIDSKSISTNKGYIEIFLDLIEETLKTQIAIAKSTPPTSEKLHRKLERKAKTTSTKKEVQLPLPPLQIDVPQKSVPSSPDLPEAPKQTDYNELKEKLQPLRVRAEVGSPKPLFQLFEDNRFLYVLVFVIAILAIYSGTLYWKMSNIETQFIHHQHSEDLYTKIAFLEYFVENINRISENNTCNRNHLYMFGKSLSVDEILEEWLVDIKTLQQSVKSDIETSLLENLLSKQEILMAVQGNQITNQTTSFWWVWVLFFMFCGVTFGLKRYGII